MNDELHCPICLDWFSDPVVLDCAHHVCKKHTVDMSQQNTSGGPTTIGCPICRTESNCSKLKVNTTLRNIVKYWRKSYHVPTSADGSGDGITAICGVCERNAAIKSCRDCHGVFCEECIESSHSTGFFKTHEMTLISTDEFSDNFKLYCDTHPDERLSLYCSDCKVAVCAHCLLVGEHVDHQRQSLKSAFDDSQKHLGDWITKLDKVKAISNNFATVLNKLTVDIDGSFDDHIEHIDQIIEEITAALKAKRDELLTHGANIKNSKEKIVKSQQNSNDTVLAKVNQLTKRGLSIQSISNYHTFLTLYPPLVQDIKSMLNIRMNFTPETDPHFSTINNNNQLIAVRSLQNTQGVAVPAGQGSASHVQPSQGGYVYVQGGSVTAPTHGTTSNTNYYHASGTSQNQGSRSSQSSGSQHTPPPNTGAPAQFNYNQSRTTTTATSGSTPGYGSRSNVVYRVP